MTYLTAEIVRRNAMFEVTTSRPNLDSPLRYPGGKSSLTQFLARCVELMNADDVTYVEPYAGGAGAAISLLMRNKVSRIVINDLDPAVNSFWNSVISDGARVADRIRNIPLSLDEWARQREIYRAGRADDPFDLGMAFFYLNRTNRSGVLNAGVIGGRAQQGKYKIDARFNREQLVNRITAISDLSSKIKVLSEDGRKVIESFASESNVFVYADPPYVKMGGSLYLNAFSELDHSLLATCLERNRSRWWFLTYDDAELVRSLYSRMRLGEYTLNWSARNQGASKELYVTSDPLATAMAKLA